MKRKALEALKKSIVDWIDRAQAKTPTKRDCALCVYAHRIPGGTCQACPIFHRTKLPYCQGTPYGKAYGAYEDWSFFGSSDYRKTWRKAAWNEIHFLITILPEGETVEHKGWIYGWVWQ